MSTPRDGSDLRREIEVEVEAELTAVESSGAEEAIEEPVAEWQFDPGEVQRLDVSLRSLLHAVEGLEHGTDGDPMPGGRGDAPPE